MCLSNKERNVQNEAQSDSPVFIGLMRDLMCKAHEKLTGVQLIVLVGHLFSVGK